MISFRLNPNLDSVEGRIVTGLFFFSISIIGVNLFISIMFGHFADVHAMQSKLKSKTGYEDHQDEVFNFELNEHLWKQMNRIKNIFSEPKIGEYFLIIRYLYLNSFDQVWIVTESCLTLFSV